MTDWFEDLLDKWRDSYWRLDHPEVTAAVIAVLTGLIGLLFSWLQACIARNAQAQES